MDKDFHFKSKKAKGYMTVEAGFVMPWVIFLFVFLIYAGFYLYDKCVLFQDAYTVCFRGSIQKEEADVLDYINAHMKEQFGSKYFGTGEVQGSARKEGQVVIVSGICNVRVPLDHFLTMAGKDGWRIQTEARARIVNPTKIIRRCRMAENALKYLQE
ncbi:MAG: pilus assembly protein [Lachnospiraceae bacterium]|nr:pilus assembly protein [Lachnospiraceae bacterium]